MVTVLVECNTEEQRSVVRFLWAKELDAKDSHKEMFPVYSGMCFLHKVVHNWVKKFSQGRLRVADAARAHHPVEMVKEATVQRVEELIQAERRITMDSAATALGCSHG
jgi:hypothetical protein